MQGTGESCRSAPWIPFAFTATLVILLDILTKFLITETLGPTSDRHNVRVIALFVKLDYGENSGIAFGLLSDASGVVWVLVSLAVLGMAVLVWMTMQSASREMTIAMGMIAGGGLANLIDRLADGHVVDFISLWRWPSFNLADASITVGVAILLILVFRQERAQRQ